MTVKIGLISDVHATAAPVREALAILQREGVETILCPGDIAGYGTELELTVELLIARAPGGTAPFVDSDRLKSRNPPE